MMKKKVFAVVFLAAAAAACGLRINSVNSAAGYPVIQEYSVGDEVLMENDFFDSLDEAADGYSIKVTGKEILTREEFCQKYGADNDELDENSDYLYLINLNVRNINNSNGSKNGINLRHFIFQNRGYITYLDDTAYPYVNDFKDYSFCLKYNTDKDFVMPIGINADQLSISDLENGDSKLVVTLYPHKKSISLN